MKESDTRNMRRKSAAASRLKRRNRSTWLGFGVGVGVRERVRVGVKNRGSGSGSGRQRVSSPPQSSRTLATRCLGVDRGRASSLPLGRSNWGRAALQEARTARCGTTQIARTASCVRPPRRRYSAHAAVLDCPNMRKRSALIGWPLSGLVNLPSALRVFLTHRCRKDASWAFLRSPCHLARAPSSDHRTPMLSAGIIHEQVQTVAHRGRWRRNSM